MQLASTIYRLTEVVYEDKVSVPVFTSHLQKVYELAKRLDVETHKTPKWVCAGKAKSKEFLFFGDGSLLIITLEEEKPIKFEPYSHD